MADTTVRFRLKAHKPSRPEAKSGNVPGIGTTPAIKVSGCVPKENVAPVIVVPAVTFARARVNVADPSTKGLKLVLMEALEFG